MWLTRSRRGGVPSVFNNVFNNFERDFFDLLKGFDSSLDTAFNSSFLPSVEVKEFDSNYLITAELPGISEKDISVKVNENTLSISGKKEERKSNDSKTHISTISYGEFSRSFTLPKDVDIGKINASFNNGILTINLAKNMMSSSDKEIPINKNVKTLSAGNNA